MQRLPWLLCLLACAPRAGVKLTGVVGLSCARDSDCSAGLTCNAQMVCDDGSGQGSAGKAPSALTYADNPAHYQLGMAIAPNTPSVAGGTPSKFTAPVLPSGLAIDSASGVISGTPSAVSAATGYTVSAENAAGSSNVSLLIDVSAAGPLVSATTSGVDAAPSTLPADGTSTTTVTVTLRDAAGDPVAGRRVTLSSSRGAADDITTLAATTDASGRATFSVSAASVGSAIFTATDTTDGIAVAATVNVTFSAPPPSATKSTVVATPPAVPADGATTASVTVTLQDTTGAPLAGRNVTLASSRGASDNISPSASPTDNAGHAVFLVASAATGNPTFTATDVSDALVLTATASVSFTPPPVSAALSALSAAPASVPADGATKSDLTLTLKDTTGAPVAGKAAAVTSSRGATDTVSPATALTDAAGQASFHVQSTTAGNATLTATDTTDGIVVMQTASVTFLAQYTLTLTKKLVIDANGTVTGSGGINCGATCNAVFSAGSSASLTSADASFQVFLIDCPGASCVKSTALPTLVTMNGNHSVQVVFRPPFNYMFVTAGTYAPGSTAGAINGLLGADAICKAEAVAAGLGGNNYVAFLASSLGTAFSRLGAARGWMRTDGLGFADDVASLLTNGKVFYPPRLDANGVDLGPFGTSVLTATNRDGSYDGVNGACGDYMSTAGSIKVGDTSRGSDGWAFNNSGAVGCAFPYHFYCFQTDYTQAFTPPIIPANGRRAFLSSAFNPSTGGVTGHVINDFDNHCMADAGGAALAGTFRAFLATSGGPMADANRFDFSLGPWYRLDGVQVVALASDYQNGIAGLAAVQLDIAGVYRGQNLLATGAPFSGDTTSNGTAASTCNNWTDTSGAFHWGNGIINYYVGNWGGVGVLCTAAENVPVICLQI